MRDPDPPRGPPFQQAPPAFLLSPGSDNGRRLFPALTLLQAAAPLALTSTPSPLWRNSSKMNVPGQLAGPLLCHRKFPRNAQGIHTFYTQ